MPEFISLIKKAAIDAYEQASPMDALTGKVESTEPVSIRISEKIILNADRLILTKNVTDHYITAEVNHITGYTACGDGSHSHSYSGTKKYFVKNGLKNGDRVLLIRCGGGQTYIVLEKLGGDGDDA